MDAGQLASRYPVPYRMAEEGELRRDVRGEPCPRGPDTFRRIGGHPRGRAVVELAVDHAVPDAVCLIGRVGRWRGGEELEVWRQG